MRPIYVNPLSLKNRTAVNHWQREIDFASPLLKRAGSHSPASRRKRIIVDTYNLPDEEEIPITEYYHRPRTAIKTEYYHRPKVSCMIIICLNKQPEYIAIIFQMPLQIKR